MYNVYHVKDFELTTLDGINICRHAKGTERQSHLMTF